jgi:GNAT superfamily N-acetyltransferase
VESIRRLSPEDAAAIVDCFRRVYGDSYANELFNDARALAEALRVGRVGSVGAVAADGMMLGHMAMTVYPDASVVELGNTVVDPAARGGGLAWKVGAELSSWCRELGYQGFLHYPTTDHHIMQRQSVKAGFETGLMLGYIPAETHGQVGDAGGRRQKRQAATIVYEPYGEGAGFDGYLPDEYAELLQELAAPTELPRKWQTAALVASSAGGYELHEQQKRGLSRLVVVAVGRTLTEGMDALEASPAPCQQIDFSLADAAVGHGVRAARARGFRFCGWLPGFREGDVLRLQRLQEAVADLNPGLENPVARRLLQVYAAGC